jgi:hypothetical protein
MSKQKKKIHRINIRKCSSQVQELIGQSNSFNFQVLVLYDEKEFCTLPEDLNEQVFLFIQKYLNAVNESQKIQASRAAFDDLEQHLSDKALTFSDFDIPK